MKYEYMRAVCTDVLPACPHTAYLVPQSKRKLGCLMEPSCVYLKWSGPGWGVKRKQPLPHRLQHKLKGQFLYGGS